MIDIFKNPDVGLFVWIIVIIESIINLVSVMNDLELFDLRGSYYEGVKDLAELRWIDFQDFMDTWHYLPFVLVMLPLGLVQVMISIPLGTLIYTVIWPFIHRR